VYQKKRAGSTVLFISLIVILSRMNCFNRANISTCTTVGANIRINFVNVAFRYRFNRTFINACSASSTIIINFVSHFDYFLVMIITIRLQKYLKFLKSEKNLANSIEMIVVFSSSSKNQDRMKGKTRVEEHNGFLCPVPSRPL
jgi:hypothetical protein